MVLSKIAADAGLLKILREAFPDTEWHLLSLAWYIASIGDALSHGEAWCKNHKVPSGKALGSQRISDLLVKISEIEKNILRSAVTEIEEIKVFPQGSLPEKAAFLQYPGRLNVLCVAQGVEAH